MPRLLFGRHLKDMAFHQPFLAKIIRSFMMECRQEYELEMQLQTKLMSTIVLDKDACVLAPMLFNQSAVVRD